MFVCGGWVVCVWGGEWGQAKGIKVQESAAGLVISLPQPSHPPLTPLHPSKRPRVGREAAASHATTLQGVG